MSRRAFITGITGQDGSYLAEHLLDTGYEVFGMIRRHSDTTVQCSRINHLLENDLVTLEYGDLLDYTSMEEMIGDIQPTHIYNLAAQSHVQVSTNLPQYTIEVNVLGLVNMLESTKRAAPNARFYQASSSEMFGNVVDSDGFQRESTKMVPVSPYGCAKLFGHNYVRHYREAFDMFAVSGILFNHESPRRGLNFVTNKLVKAAVDVSQGKIDSVSLGNLDAQRDWGHAEDYIRAMSLIINADEPKDYVVSSGETHSVREVGEYVFDKMGLDFNKHYTVDPKYLRAEELHRLRGDSTRIREELGWSPTYNFHTMLDDMIDYWNEQ